MSAADFMVPQAASMVAEVEVSTAVAADIGNLLTK
jgi:hypothetical protein